MFRGVVGAWLDVWLCVMVRGHGYGAWLDVWLGGVVIGHGYGEWLWGVVMGAYGIGHD